MKGKFVTILKPIPLLFLVLVSAAVVWSYEAPVLEQKTYREVKNEALELLSKDVPRGLCPFDLFLLYYWQESYQLLLDTDTFLVAYEKWKARGNPPCSDYMELYRYTRQYYEAVRGAIVNKAELEDMERDLLELFLVFLLNRDRQLFNSQQQVNALVNDYKREHPSSPYIGFLQEVVYVPLVPSDVGLLAAAYAGVGLPCAGTVPDPFGAYGYLAAEVGFSYRKFIALIRTAVGFSREYVLLQIELSAGYAIGLGSRITATPMLYAGLITAAEYEKEDPDVEFEVAATPVLKLGVRVAGEPDSGIVHELVLRVECQVAWGLEDRHRYHRVVVAAGYEQTDRRLLPVKQR